MTRWWGKGDSNPRSPVRGMTVFRHPLSTSPPRVYRDPDFLVEGVELVDRHPSPFQIGSIPRRPRGINVSSKDRDFRPTRRRGFDDDNFETPRRSFGSTPGSGAQRFEAPSGPPVQAVVKWYNPEKGFGFVELADGSGDAFLHVSVVERSGHGSVPPGAMLEVRAGPGPKGPQVSEILSVDSSNERQEPPRRARPERIRRPTGPPSRSPARSSGTMPRRGLASSPQIGAARIFLC